MGTTPRPLRLAVTAGDPLGIGPEVAKAALDGFVSAEATVYGDARLLEGVERIVDVPLDGELPAVRGPSRAGGRASLAALERALEDVRAARADALVTAPISKESWALADVFPDGHTGWLGRKLGVPEPLMSFVWDRAEPVVALLTTHIPLRAVASSLTSKRVERALRRLHEALLTRFRRPRARLGICGLNPHAGEHGLMGTEEGDFLEPALERLRADGIEVAGPLPADTAFAFRERYDGLLALYHDQGLAPVKALAFERAVNVTLGLPLVRTSPSHGTAFGLAGRGQADPASMRAALEWAVRLAR